MKRVFLQLLGWVHCRSEKDRGDLRGTDKYGPVCFVWVFLFFITCGALSLCLLMTDVFYLSTRLWDDSGGGCNGVRSSCLVSRVVCCESYFLCR
jgi:hypothetical protein